MYQFVESICCQGGKAQLLSYHQDRVNRTFEAYYVGHRPIQLSDILKDQPIDSGLVKCRVEYSATEVLVTSAPYSTPNIKSLQLVESQDISYAHKALNRTSLDQLYADKSESDDIIIFKNGMLTDSYFANLAFFDGQHWFTPGQPLLRGVKRQHLIDQGILLPRDISVEHLGDFNKVSLINAMLDLGDVEMDINQVKS